MYFKCDLYELLAPPTVQLAERHSCKFFETSAFTGVGVKEAFTSLAELVLSEVYHHSVSVCVCVCACARARVCVITFYSLHACVKVYMLVALCSCVLNTHEHM